jgi:hypothetical protein
MYKAGDVVVNRRGDVCTIVDIPTYGLCCDYATYKHRLNKDGTAQTGTDYDIVGYAKMTPKGELDEAYDALKNQFTKMESEVKTPSHYHRLSPEPIVVLEQWNLGNCLSNAIKYICRAGHKDDAVKDLRKAIEYLERKIEMIENDNV